jgi:molybdopterin molybdotransferase
MGEVRLTESPIPVEKLQKWVLSAVKPFAVSELPLIEAHGLAVAADMCAPIALPRFDNSGMDGYAVVSADLAGASGETPVTLPVVGEIGAGQAGLLAISPGSAAKIMTGAPVPAGCDAVVPYEWTDRGAAQVRVTRAPTVGQHVRPAGEDVAEGDILVAEGTVLGARQIGLLAAVGYATVPARPRPRVVVISTGSELRDPGAELPRDAIYDGNSYLLAAAAREAGAIAYRVGIVPDDPQSFLDTLQDQLVRADLVVTSGGISQGDFDVVKEALSTLDTMWFGGVAMQPGKPQGFGVIGDDRIPVFTLPGNPVSCFVSFEMFVLPAIRRMLGKQPYLRPMQLAQVTSAVRSPEGRRQYVRARHSRRVADPVGGHGSHLLGDLAAANALLVVPEETTLVNAGEQVGVLLLDEDF